MNHKTPEIKLCFGCCSQSSDPDPDVDVRFFDCSDPERSHEMTVDPEERWLQVQRIACYYADYRHIAVMVHGMRIPLVSVTNRGGTEFCARHAAAYASLEAAQEARR